MDDPGPSSGRLPLIEPDTSNFINGMFASSVPTQPGPIIALASTDAIAPSLAFNGIQVTDPSTQANGIVSARINKGIKLSVTFHPGSAIQFLKIPKTQSVHEECDIPEQYLKFSLELKGADGQTVITRVCPNCKKRKDQATWDIVDFRADTTVVTIDVEGGATAASFEFFIKCYAPHHGLENFCADAVLRDHDNNVIHYTSLPLRFDIKGKAKSPANPAKAQRRAMRGMSAQQRSEDYTMHPDNPLASDIYTYNVALGITPMVPRPARHHRQTRDSVLHHISPPTLGKGGQHTSLVDTTAGFLPAVDPFFWTLASPPVNAPSLITTSASQHVVQPSEVGLDPRDMGFLHPVDTLPLESNIINNPSGMGTRAPTNGEQIPPITSCEISSVPRVLEPTSGEPHCGGGINQPSRGPGATSQMLSQNILGIPRVLNTPPVVPSGQGCGVPGVSIQCGPSQLGVESPVNTSNEGINQNTSDTRVQEVSPRRGPMTGGMDIVLFGERFPAFPLYVGFGDKWVRARWHDARVLRCCLPPSDRPGIVDVMLSREPSNSAPEVGWSTATFEYEDSRVGALLAILKNIYQWANGTIQQLRPAQSFAAMNTVRDPSLNTSTTHSSNQEQGEIPPGLDEENIEDISIHFLCTCSKHPDWKQVVSSRNEYGQTMAHLCVTLGYFRLLQHLCTWEIDLNAVDQMGSTALHYAYLFQQEMCAKVLIHAGVDQFILDDLARSPSDLDPSLEARIRSNMDMDSDSSAGGVGGLPIECDAEEADQEGKPYEKHLLIQQWMVQGEDEKMGEVPLSKCQSQETGGLPALGPTEERVRGVTYDQSSSLDARTPEEHPTPVVAEEIDMKASIEIATPPHIAHPPSPISKLSPQTQKLNRPPDSGQNPFSHPTPLGDTPNLEDRQFFWQRKDFQSLTCHEPSLLSTFGQGHLPLSDTLGNIKADNDANDEKLLQRSGSSPESTSLATNTSPKKEWQQRSPQNDYPIPMPTYPIALDNVKNEVWEPASLQPHDRKPSIGDAIDIIGSGPIIGTPDNTLPFMTKPSQHALGPSELGSSFHNMGPFHRLDSLPPPISRPNHIPDPAVPAMYQDLHLQAELKDPKKQQPGATVNIRREKKVVLTLALHSDSHPVSNRGWEGILLPQTRSVESVPVQQISSAKLLKLSIQVLACARGDVNARPCNNCWSRERPPNDPNAQPYMIDFQAQSRQIALGRNNIYLMADVKFHFTCVSRHHEGLFGLVLKLHDESDNLVAHTLLPYKFAVKVNGNDTSVGYSETQEHTTAQQQTQWPVFPVPNQPPAPIMETRSRVAPVNPHSVPANQHVQPNSNLSASILQRLSPAEGPLSGGPTILLTGINFPPPHQQMVYARFGAVVVPTMWHSAHVLECTLPPSPTPGPVSVTLSLFPQPGGPEFGQSRCSFRYNLVLDYIHALLREISGNEHSLTPENWDAMIPHFVQRVSPAGRQRLHQATQPTQPMNPSFSTTAGEMGALSVQLLASFTNSTSWEDSISFVNEHRQTLAHLAVLFRYTTLLDKVAQWGINVDVQDVNGFTALHCAYLCGDMGAVRILKSYGADEDVKDSLGRRPMDMYIPRENGSPTSDYTTDEWVKVSPASSQLGSFDGCESNPAKDLQLDAGESTTSSRIVPASVSLPSPTYDTSSSTDVLTNKFGKFGPHDSSTELEPSRSSPHFTDVPVVQLCPPSSESWPPAQAHQGGCLDVVRILKQRPSPTSGTVSVTLSLYQRPGGPEFGQSHGTFRYNLELDNFYALLRTVLGNAHTLIPENWDAMIPHSSTKCLRSVAKDCIIPPLPRRCELGSIAPRGMVLASKSGILAF